MAQTTTSLYQAVAIQYGMNGALGRDFDAGEPAHQAFADFSGAPAGMLSLHVEDVVLHLKGQLIGIAIGSPASIRQSFNPAFLIAIENFIAGLTGNTELPAQFRHRFAGDAASDKLKSFVHYRTLLPRHGYTSSPYRGRKCNLCVRYELLPMCRVAHQRLTHLVRALTYVQLRPNQFTIPAVARGARAAAIHSWIMVLVLSIARRCDSGTH